MGIKVGLQVFSIKESMAADPASAIENAAKDGYRYLEAANHRALEDAGIGVGLTAEELKKSTGCHRHRDYQRAHFTSGQGKI